MQSFNEGISSAVETKVERIPLMLVSSSNAHLALTPDDRLALRSTSSFAERLTLCGPCPHERKLANYSTKVFCRHVVVRIHKNSVSLRELDTQR